MVLIKDKKQEIEAKTVDILETYYGYIENIKPPIKASAILDKTGLKIISAKFKDENVSGYYNKKEKRIYVSSSENIRRQIFTIAHELGHFYLHADLNEETFYRQQALNINEEHDEREEEANLFAASLLMPKELVEIYWSYSRNWEEMANIFIVSKSAMFFRLKNLGLIN